MSSDQGYVYRVASAHAQQLQEIIETHVGECWTFGASAQWDLKPLSDHENLRHIKESKSAITAADLVGDFGYAFSEKAEVRWKRRDNGSYDLLMLSEEPRTIPEAEALTIPTWNAQTETWEAGIWRTRPFSTAALRRLKGNSIIYIDYLAPNGAVQFQRLVKLKKESSNDS